MLSYHIALYSMFEVLGTWWTELEKYRQELQIAWN